MGSIHPVELINRQLVDMVRETMRRLIQAAIRDNPSLRPTASGHTLVVTTPAAAPAQSSNSPTSSGHASGADRHRPDANGGQVRASLSEKDGL